MAELITLKNLHEKTEQEVFDYVANHLLTQNVKCQDVDGVCRYRFASRKCGAGCLISDEEYDRKLMEKHTWGNLIRYGVVPSVHQSIIMSLQRVHDDYEPEEWRDQLIYIAKENNLNYKHLI